jgi:hypothetical protein
MRLPHVTCFHIGERMWKCSCCRPWHREHHMYRYAQGLPTVYVSERGWIRDDCVCDERLVGDRVWGDARIPTPTKHFVNHLSFAWDIASFQGVERGEESGVADHVLMKREVSSEKSHRLQQSDTGCTYRHQIFWVAADRVEFQPRFPHKVCKGIMCCKTYTMTITLEGIT